MATLLDLGAAESFVLHSGRLIDRRRFAALFGAAEPSGVLSALAAYQNADGGFGNALEPDLRGPESEPVPTWMALTVLDEVDRFEDPMVVASRDYLASITTSEGGVPFVLPDARGYPHAPWWETGNTLPASVNLTAASPASSTSTALTTRGSWPINWPVWTPATGLEWRAWQTINALSTLRAYGRLA